MNGDWIEAKIDLAHLNDTQNQVKQNIFSIGSDISKWSTGNDGAYNIHFYYPHKEKDDHLLRFSAVIGEKVNNVTRRTKGVIKIPNDVITIRLSEYGISIDGVQISRFTTNKINDLINSGDEGNYKYIVEDDQPINTYQYLIDNYLMTGLIYNLQVGSKEGSARSWATYEYIKYHLNLFD